GLAAGAVAFAAACAAGPRVTPLPASTIAPAAAPAPAKTAALSQIFDLRHAQNNDGDYVLGEGDVISVKAYALEELNTRVRVDGDGSITLPLLDTVKVAGQTVSQVQQGLTKRLGDFMYNPHVAVFVEEYRSQQVSVLGAVQRPGPISQTARNTTIREALSAAG